MEDAAVDNEIIALAIGQVPDEGFHFGHGGVRALETCRYLEAHQKALRENRPEQRLWR